MPSMIAATMAVPHAHCCIYILPLLFFGAVADVVNVDEAQAQRSEGNPASGSSITSLFELSRLTFTGNVLRDPSAEEFVENWVIAFCPSWWEPCQNFLMAYEMAGQRLERKFNTALLTKTVRFAMIDCATDKVLCNEQSVTAYPTVHHYQKGKIVATWQGSGRPQDTDRYAKWIAKQIAKMQMEAAATEAAAMKSSNRSFLPGDRALDLLLVMGLLSLNWWAVCSNPQLWQKPAVLSPLKESAGVADAPKEVSAGVAVDCTTEPATTSTARLLPEDWKMAREGLEL